MTLNAVGIRTRSSACIGVWIERCAGADRKAVWDGRCGSLQQLMTLRSVSVQHPCAYCAGWSSDTYDAAGGGSCWREEWQWCVIVLNVVGND
jgi:hypothetical protein